LFPEREVGFDEVIGSLPIQFYLRNSVYFIATLQVSPANRSFGLSLLLRRGLFKGEHRDREGWKGLVVFWGTIKRRMGALRKFLLLRQPDKSMKGVNK
jgi:hypothetical protein